jgi:hypothetical protein
MSIVGISLDAGGWQAIGSMLQGVGTLGGAIAVWWVARRAVTDWREQRQVELQIQAADQILIAAYSVAEYAATIFEPLEWYKNADPSAKAYLGSIRFSEKTHEDHLVKARSISSKIPLALTYFGHESVEMIRGFEESFLWSCSSISRVRFILDKKEENPAFAINEAIEKNQIMKEYLHKIEDEISKYIRKI